MDAPFKVVRPTQTFRKSVLVIDDVVTTGATLGAVIDALVAGGVERIGVACLAGAKK